MGNNEQLNTAWLTRLTNPHHDGTTQQIDDFVQSFVTDNARFLEKRTAVHQCRQKEDEVWMKAQRDPAVKRLDAADNRQDAYVSAARYIINAHAGLPDDEPTKAEAQVCEQVFKDYKFRTDNAKGAEADKIIQMAQNFQPHQAFLTQIGAWTFYQKAIEAAKLVREILGERALTVGSFVKNEMADARRSTDQAIADLYKTIMAMLELVPSAELTALVTQLKGIELYAKQYYISNGKPSGGGSGSVSQSGSGSNSGSGSGSGSEQGGGTGTITPSGDDNGGGSGSGSGGSGSGSGDAGSGDNGGGDDNGGTQLDEGGTPDSDGNGGFDNADQ